MMVRICYCRNVDHPLPLVAWLIMIFQKMMPWNKNSWNHMSIRFSGYNNLTYHLDATGKYGVSLKTEEEFLNIYRVVEYSEININTPLKDFTNWAKKHVGKKYDKLQILGLLIKNTLSFVSFNRIGHNDRKIVCSEMIILLLREYKGLKVVDTDNYDLLDARELVTKESLNGSISQASA